MSSEPTSTAERQARGREFYFEILSGLALVVLIGFFVGCSWLYAREPASLDWPFTTAILALPLLQVPLLILLLWKNSDFARSAGLLLVPSLFLEVLLWYAFTFRRMFPHALELAARVGLAWSLVIGVVTFWVTALIMGLADGRSSRFQQALRRNPFLVVCFFLTTFTFIPLFLSLSLGLHDQGLRLNNKSLGLFARDLNPATESPTAGESTSPQAPFTMLFRRGSEAVEVIAEPASEEEGPTDPEGRRKLHNERQLASLTSALLAASERDRVRVVLAGHSDDLPIDAKNSSFRTNFELSEARVHHVIIALLGRLTASEQKQKGWRRNVEWLVLPCASGPSFLGTGKRRPEENLSVEVMLLSSEGDQISRVNQPSGRDLRLLDYLYFGIYSITTTGYGDIVPVSSYSKFIACVANLFAAFFMVVFFNVLLSFLREARSTA